MSSLRQRAASWFRRASAPRVPPVVAATEPSLEPAATAPDYPRIPILTYHSAKSIGYTYESNDHLALEVDLRLIRSLGMRLVSIDEVVQWALDPERHPMQRGGVAITFDDAPDWDYYDFIHPDVNGCLKSFYRLLVEHVEKGGLAPDRGSYSVSFAIADPDARVTLDRYTMAGRGHWRDDWWAVAASTGVLGIGNHSWDHAHVGLPVIRQREQRKGTFLGIDNEADADAQIAEAQRLIWYRSSGQALPYFAYPYGHATPYLVNEYLPNFGERHKLQAAFGTQGQYVTPRQNRWHLPRFMCGEHWFTPGELEVILRGSLEGSQ